jgi:hypothetical protein
MEASTVAPEQAEQNGAPAEGGAEATRTSAHLFEYSTYVHVGEGARECEHREDGECKDPQHFHAWLCLPNTLQHNDIVEKGRAAAARRKMAFRDPETDAYAILESELDEAMREDREGYVVLIAEDKLRKKIMDLITEVREQEEFADIGQHREELVRQQALPEDQRSDDFDTLTKLVAEYDETLEARISAERENIRAGLRTLADEPFREALREHRIEHEAEQMRSTTYYTWMGFICTRKCPGGVASFRYWPKMDDMKAAPPEVIRALDEALDELESRLNRGDASGN